MKKVFSILLAMSLVVTMVAVGGFNATAEETGSNWNTQRFYVDGLSKNSKVTCGSAEGTDTTTHVVQLNARSINDIYDGGIIARPGASDTTPIIAGDYYDCEIGAFSAGTYNVEITQTNNNAEPEFTFYDDSNIYLTTSERQVTLTFTSDIENLHFKVLATTKGTDSVAYRLTTRYIDFTKTTQLEVNSHVFATYSSEIEASSTATKLTNATRLLDSYYVQIGTSNNNHNGFESGYKFSAAGEYVTYGFYNVPKGIYSVMFLSSTAGTATYPNLAVTNADTGEELGTYTSTQGTYQAVNNTFENITIDGSLKIKLTALAEGNYYGGAIILTKTADFPDEVKYDVSLDGNITKVLEGEQYTFPTLNESGIVYTDGVNYYDAGESVEVNSNLSFTTISISLSMRSGASMRLSAISGIRYYTIIDTAQIEALKQIGATVEFGTLISPSDLIGENALTFDIPEENRIDVKYIADEYYTEDDFEGIVGSIGNVKDANANREFVGRGYAKVTINGKAYTKYASYANNDIANNTRTISWIATQVHSNDAEYSKLSGNAKEAVDKYCGLYIG